MHCGVCLPSALHKLRGFESMARLEFHAQAVIGRRSYPQRLHSTLHWQQTTASQQQLGVARLWSPVCCRDASTKPRSCLSSAPKPKQTSRRLKASWQLLLWRSRRSGRQLKPLQSRLLALKKWTWHLVSLHTLKRLHSSVHSLKLVIRP